MDLCVQFIEWQGHLKEKLIVLVVVIMHVYV